MATYGTLRTFYSAARNMGGQTNKTEVAMLLGETLQEESDTDRILTTIAETVVNPEMARSSRLRVAARLPMEAPLLIF
ncbi:MAG: DUF892 family protein [Armatimonas sp.]